MDERQAGKMKRRCGSYRPGADRLVLCTLCALLILIHFLGSTDCWRGKSLPHGDPETWLAGLFHSQSLLRNPCFCG